MFSSKIKKLVSLVLCVAIIVCLPYCNMAHASEESYKLCMEYERLLASKKWSRVAYWGVPNNSNKAPWYVIGEFQYSLSFAEMTTSSDTLTTWYTSILTCDDTGSAYLTTTAETNGYPSSCIGHGKISFNWTSDSNACFLLIDAGDCGVFLYAG